MESGKSALIVGAGPGISMAFARLLAARQYAVALVRDVDSSVDDHRVDHK